MIEFQDVMLRVKDILIQKKQGAKILDRDIANSLELDPQYFAVIKRRKKIPYKNLAYFCKKNSISLNWILLKQKPQYLKSIFE
jgi:hypothetical protein